MVSEDVTLEVRSVAEPKLGEGDEPAWGDVVAGIVAGLSGDGVVGEGGLEAARLL